MSEKITLIFTIWILIAFLLTPDSALEIFFILIFIGILIIRELSDLITTTNLKERMNTFIYIFLLIFIGIVSQKILSILGIT